MAVPAADMSENIPQYSDWPRRYFPRKFDTNANEQWRTSVNKGRAKTLNFATYTNNDEQ
jgi:hypothetical protein